MGEARNSRNFLACISRTSEELGAAIVLPNKCSGDSIPVLTVVSSVLIFLTFPQAKFGSYQHKWFFWKGFSEDIGNLLSRGDELGEESSLSYFLPYKVKIYL